MFPAKRRIQKIERAMVNFARLLVLICAVLSVAQNIARAGSTSVAGQTSKTGLWRVPNNDGINCLYLQLRAMGYGGSYENFISRTAGLIGDDSATGLAEIARREGFNLVPVQLSMNELSHFGMPVICHIEDSGTERGMFCLFVGAGNGSVDLVQGGSVSWTQLPRETFERAWSGCVLVPMAPSQLWEVARRLSTAALLLGAASSVYLHRQIVPWGR